MKMLSHPEGFFLKCGQNPLLSSPGELSLNVSGVVRSLSPKLPPYALPPLASVAPTPCMTLRELSSALPPTPPTPDCAPSSQPRPTLLRHCTGHTRRARTSPHTHPPPENTAHSWGLAGTDLKDKTASYIIPSKMSLFMNSREL